MHIKSQVTYCFIDGQNLYMGIKALGWQLDYKKLYRYLQDKYNADTIVIYLGYVTKYLNLYKSLTNIGFKLKFKEVKYIDTQRKAIKGNVDVDLTVDSIRKASNYDLAIFISADGDFLALYEYLLNDLNKSILILVPNSKRYSKLLLKHKKYLRFMNDLQNKLSV